MPGKGITMDDPTPLGKSLGCNHEIGTAYVDTNNCLQTYHDPDAKPEDIPAIDPTWTKVQGMVYNMEDFLGSCVTKYQGLAGERGDKLRHVETPYLDEATLDDLDDEITGGNNGAATANS